VAFPDWHEVMKSNDRTLATGSNIGRSSIGRRNLG